jgi:predicted XRE-type DNA-binding protein
MFVETKPQTMKNRNELFTEINNGLDLAKIDFEKLDRDQLIEYAYALDWNGSWDIDEEGQEPITKSELLEAIKNLISYL